MWLGREISVEAFLGLVISSALLGWDYGHCLSPDHRRQWEAAKRSCPENRFYYPQTKKCYIPWSKGPCGDLMRLEKSAGNENTVECRCFMQSDDGGCTPPRPLLFVNESSRCYPMFHQGPCRNGEWLVAGEASTGVCEDVPCPEKYYNQFSSRPWSLPYEDKFFVFADRGECITTGDRCTATDAVETVFIDDQTLLPKCIPSRMCPPQSWPSGGSVGWLDNNGCGEGLEPDSQGGCEPLASI